ncbi:hypothetical protein [Pirellula sp. SH-Sr6A]|uniref:hypothetical protein n=1 Tax=Pirellula sp. SH-Sr6A TaxID=1632865 RepID=UPI0011BA7728|nr:hypothetical protein [Pirellula sp. SH-Sr6A]
MACNPNCAGKSSLLSSLILSMLCLTLSGCSMLVGRSKGPLDNLDTQSLKAAGYGIGPHGAERPVLTDNGETCVVLDITDGKRHLEKLPLQNGQSLFVGDVIRDADLFKKIGRMKVTVLRPNGGNRPPVRMDVDFDDSGKHVMEGQNYSLRPGDHIMIRRDEKPFFGGMLKSMASR